MGYIKGRFCSLRGLWQQINNAKDHEHAIIWIKACIILHTLVFIIENGDEDPSFIEDLIKKRSEGLALSSVTDGDGKQAG